MESAAHEWQPKAMTRQRWWLGGAGAVGLAAVALSSCSTLERTVVAPPMIEGASFAGNKACYECHTNITGVFPSSAHARLQAPDLRMKDRAGCESCHGPGSKHIQAGGGRGRF